MAGRTSFERLRYSLSDDGRAKAASLTVTMDSDLEIVARTLDQQLVRLRDFGELAKGGDVPETS